MSFPDITNLILEYRYVILLPLSIIEGPIVAFVAGTLATLGYFNVFILAVFFFFMDLAKDAFYYSLGYWGGRRPFTRRLMKKIGVEQDHLDSVRVLWETHPGKTMFLGKLSYGIASGFVVLAGTVHMPVKKFFGWGALVAIAQYWTLLALGYFFGETLSPSSQHLVEELQYAVAIIALVASAYYIFGLLMRKEWKKETKEEGIDGTS